MGLVAQAVGLAAQAGASCTDWAGEGGGYLHRQEEYCVAHTET